MPNVKEHEIEKTINDVLRPAGGKLKILQDKDKEPPVPPAMGDGSAAGQPGIA